MVQVNPFRAEALEKKLSTTSDPRPKTPETKKSSKGTSRMDSPSECPYRICLKIHRNQTSYPLQKNERKLDGNFDASSVKQRTSKPKAEPSRSERTPQGFSVSPRYLVFKKNLMGRCQPRQRAGKNFTGGEAALPTTLRRAALASARSKYSVRLRHVTTGD